MYTTMKLLTVLMPGSLVASLVSGSICVATCILILISHPVNLVPLFILAAGSLGIHVPVMVMLFLHELSSRGILGQCEHEQKLRGVHVAINQIALTFVHLGIWLAVVGVFIADLVHTLSSPLLLTCPSATCVTYSSAITLSYIHFFILTAQLLGFGLMIYELQSAPRRVLPDRSLAHILQKSVAQLISLREEVRRVRSLGPDPLHSSSRCSETYMSETAGTLRRAETGLNLPSLKLKERVGGRRRTRTVSASTSITSFRLQNHVLTLDEVRPVVVGPNIFSQKANGGLESSALHTSYLLKADNGRYPVHTVLGHQDLAIVNDHQGDSSSPFDHGLEEDLNLPSPLSGRKPFARPKSLAIVEASRRFHQPAKAESAVIPFSPTVIGTPITPITPSTPFSPASKYSRWSAEVATPRTSRIALTRASLKSSETGQPDSPPEDNNVVTPF